MGIEASSDLRSGRLGSVYIRISSARIAKTVPVAEPDDPELLMDIAADGSLVGVEILGAELLRRFCKDVAGHLPAPYKSQMKQYCPA